MDFRNKPSTFLNSELPASTLIDKEEDNLSMPEVSVPQQQPQPEQEVVDIDAMMAEDEQEVVDIDAMMAEDEQANLDLEQAKEKLLQASQNNRFNLGGTGGGNALQKQAFKEYKDAVIKNYGFAGSDEIQAWDRAKIGFALDPDDPEQIMQVLQKTYGDDAKITQMAEIGNFGVTLPDGTKYIVNDPDFTFRDAVDVLSAAPVLAGETAGYIRGGRTGGAIGAGLGEALRVAFGRMINANEADWLDIAKEAGKEAAGVYLADKGLELFSRYAQRVAQGKVTIAHAVEAIKEGLGAEGMKAFKQGQENVDAAISEFGIKPTLSDQVAAGARKTGASGSAEKATQIERELERVETGTRITTQKDQTSVQLKNRIDDLLPDDIKLSDRQVSLPYDKLALELEERQLKALENAAKANNFQDRDLNNLLDMGRAVQGYGEEGIKKVRAVIDSRYDRFYDKSDAENVMVNLDGFRADMKKVNEAIQKIAPQLGEKTDSLINTLSKANRRTVKVGRDDTLLNTKAKTVTLPDEVSLRDAINSYKQLGYMVDAADRGLVANANINELLQAKNSLGKHIDDAMAQQSPELRTEWLELKGDYQAFVRDVRLGHFGKIVQSENGAFKVLPEQVPEKLIKNLSQAQEIKKVISSYPEIAETGIEAKIQDTVETWIVKEITQLNKMTGKYELNQKAFEKLKKSDKWESIKLLVPESKLVKFNKVDDAVSAMAKQQKEREGVIKQIKESTGVNMDKLTPENVFNSVFNAKNKETRSNAIAVIKQNPEANEALLNGLKKEIRQRLTIDETTGNIDIGSFLNFKRENEDLLKEVLPEQQFNHLNKLTDTYLLVSARKGKTGDFNQDERVLNSIFRIWSGQLGTKALIRTAYMTAKKVETEKALVDLFVNPEKFGRLVKDLEKTDSNAEFLGTLAGYGIGFDALFTGLEDDTNIKLYKEE